MFMNHEHAIDALKLITDSTPVYMDAIPDPSTHLYQIRHGYPNNTLALVVARDKYEVLEHLASFTDHLEQFLVDSEDDISDHHTHLYSGAYDLDQIRVDDLGLITHLDIHRHLNTLMGRHVHNFEELNPEYGMSIYCVEMDHGSHIATLGHVVAAGRIDAFNVSQAHINSPSITLQNFENETLGIFEHTLQPTYEDLIRNHAESLASTK